MDITGCGREMEESRLGITPDVLNTALIRYAAI